MVIDISVKAFAIMAAQTIGFIGVATLVGVLFYYTDDPRVKPSRFKNTVYTVVLAIAFVLIYGIVQINWLP